MITRPESVRLNSITCSDACQELFERVSVTVSDSDPAPWVEIRYALMESLPRDEQLAIVRRKKLEARTFLVVQKGLLSGAIIAHFSDKLDSRDVPGWAWKGTERSEQIWLEGRLPLDAFLPDEWQHWSNLPVYLDRDAFTKWMDCQPLHDLAGLPALPTPYDASSKPQLVNKRLPPDTPFVTLSEALSWIAFGFALDQGSLERAIDGQAFDANDPHAILAVAMTKLAVQASGGQIAMRGKYVQSHSTDKNNVLTEPIDPLRFSDFAQFDVDCDGLRYGSGLTWDKEGSPEWALQDCRDAFCSVTINRADLLKLFPDVCSLVAHFGRSPVFKAGRPPDDSAILAKAEEMKARGLDGRVIAKTMRAEPGFENVATTTVRDLIVGRWTPTGRPKKKAHKKPAP